MITVSFEPLKIQAPPTCIPPDDISAWILDRYRSQILDGFALGPSKSDVLKLTTAMQRRHQKKDSIDDIFDFVLREILMLTGGKGARIVALDASRQQKACAGIGGTPGSIIDSVLETQDIVTDDLGFIGVPLLHGDQLVGVLALDKHGFNPHLFESVLLMCSSILNCQEQFDAKELAQANQRLHQASSAQLTHFACMSHEIRTPLNCIVGLSSLLLGSGLNPMQEESLKMIGASGDLLLTVVNDVLDYSKLESGNYDIRFQKSSLQDTLHAVVQAIDYKSQSKGVRIKTCYDPALPEFLNTDPRRLQQILYNLLGNAIKFSDSGSDIILRVCVARSNSDLEGGYSPGPPPCLCPDLSGAPSGETTCESCCSFLRSGKCAKEELENRPTVRFVVHDHGKGVSESELARIFEPFLQAHTEVDNVHGGTGLGLAITSRLVHGLSGKITVQSELDAWTRFTVDLPYESDEIDRVTISMKLAATTVLIVGDGQGIESAFEYFGVRSLSFDSMLALEKYVSFDGSLDRERSYVCLADESLYDYEVYLLLASIVDTALFTFGPNYAVSGTQFHCRSLSRIIPSVLVQEMIETIERKGDPTGRVSRRSSLRSIFSTDSYRDLRVLVAEDNVINQKVLKRMLERLEMTHVEVVNNGKEAVDREAAAHFDVILMDMQMPVMDGIQACRRILERHRDRAAPKVVFVTAHVSSTFEGECFDAGACTLLAKPFNLNEIRKCFLHVQRILNLERESDASDDKPPVDEVSLDFRGPLATKLARLADRR